MNDLHHKLLVAARLIRLSDDEKHRKAFDGIPLSELSYACARAARELRMHELSHEILTMHEPETYSRKVETQERTLRVLDGGAA